MHFIHHGFEFQALDTVEGFPPHFRRRVPDQTRKFANDSLPVERFEFIYSVDHHAGMGILQTAAQQVQTGGVGQDIGVFAQSAFGDDARQGLHVITAQEEDDQQPGQALAQKDISQANITQL